MQPQDSGETFIDIEKLYYNNRKITFDAACRTLLFDIAKRHGLELEEEPEYGGRAYLEKQDYIMAKQKEQLTRLEKEVHTQSTQLENLKQDYQKERGQQIRQTTAQSLRILGNDKKIVLQEEHLSKLCSIRLFWKRKPARAL